MSRAVWMMYGASGDTGTLIAEEAIRRGHLPLLVGCSAHKMAPLGERFCTRRSPNKPCWSWLPQRSRLIAGCVNSCSSYLAGTCRRSFLVRRER